MTQPEPSVPAPPAPPARVAPSVAAEPRRPGRVRDRDVLLLAAAVVGVVLVANLASGVFRPLDDFLNVVPVVGVLLIAVTVAVLVRSLRHSRAVASEHGRDPGTDRPTGAG